MSDSQMEHLLVAQYFTPDTASTGKLMTDLAVGLEERGLDVRVYTTQPNYHSSDCEKQPKEEIHKGVQVHRIRAPQLKQTSLLRRAFNWIIYTLWMSVVLAVSRTEKKRSVIFVSNPPFFGIPMWVVCRLRGWNYTYIVYDLWPEKGVEFGFYGYDGGIFRIWSYLHLRVFLDADHIVTLGWKMRENIVAYAPGELEDRTEIIHNWADAEFITPRSKSENWFTKRHGLNDVFALLYSGNIGLFHDLETVIRASESFEQEEYSCLIIGEGDNKNSIVSLAEEIGVRGRTVEFLPYQPREHLPYTLTSADVSVVTVQEGFEGTCVSSKLYTALAAGQPVLVIAHPESDEAAIVRKHDAGLQVRPGDVDTLVTHIRMWQSNPEMVRRQGRNARKAFETNYTKEHSIDQYYELLTGKQKIHV